MSEGGLFSGAILTGGRSRRMGRDKAFVTVEGETMVRRVARALRSAGAAEVVAVGGDEARLLAEGIDRFAPDEHPGVGPVGGLLVALADARQPIVVVVACDMPDLTPAAVGALVDALAAAPAVAAAVAEPLCAAWRPARAVTPLRRSFDAGARAMTAVIAALPHVVVPVDGAALRNVNRPGDLSAP